VSALIPQKPLLSFVAGFTALFFLWVAVASYIDVKNLHLLSRKIASLFFKSDSYFLILLVTGFVAGLTGGLAALTASYIRKKSD
jgi:hypothetical protein